MSPTNEGGIKAMEEELRTLGNAGADTAPDKCHISTLGRGRESFQVFQSLPGVSCGIFKETVRIHVLRSGHLMLKQKGNGKGEKIQEKTP